jgi:hypothetical protein
LFTGAVSQPAEPTASGGDGAGPDRALRDLRRRGAAAGSAASAYWRGWPEMRADLRSSVGIVLALALAGVPAGLLWWWLAPRADFRITDAGPVAIGNPPGEILIAGDAVFTLIVAGVGLLAGVIAWFLRRRRGVATVLALAVGACLTAVVAWQVGELLGAGPTEAQLADVGARVTTPLTLRSWPAMAFAPFTALLAYVVGVLHAHSDDLGRTEPDAGGPSWSGSLDGGDVPDTRPLVDVPPPQRPSA